MSYVRGHISTILAFPPPPLSLGTVRSPAEERTSASRASKTMYRSPCGVTAWLYYVYGWLVIYLLTYFLRVHVGGGGGGFLLFFFFSLYLFVRVRPGNICTMYCI